MRMRNSPRNTRKNLEKKPQPPVTDNPHAALQALASVNQLALKPEHLPVAKQIELYERRGNKLAAKMLRDRATEQARREGPKEQIPLDIGTGEKAEQNPRQENLNLRTEVVVKSKAEEMLIANLVRKTLAKMRPSGHRTRRIDEKTAATVIVNADDPFRPPLEKERLIGLVATEVQSRLAAKPDVQ